MSARSGKAKGAGRRDAGLPGIVRSSEALASVFAALGDPTRLKLVAVLCAGGAFSIAQLTANTEISRQGVTKHLRCSPTRRGARREAGTRTALAVGAGADEEAKRTMEVIGSCGGGDGQLKALVNRLIDSAALRETRTQAIVASALRKRASDSEKYAAPTAQRGELRHITAMHAPRNEVPWPCWNKWWSARVHDSAGPARAGFRMRHGPRKDLQGQQRHSRRQADCGIERAIVREDAERGRRGRGGAEPPRKARSTPRWETGAGPGHEGERNDAARAHTAMTTPCSP